MNMGKVHDLYEPRNFLMPITGQCEDSVNSVYQISLALSSFSVSVIFLSYFPFNMSTFLSKFPFNMTVYTNCHIEWKLAQESYIAEEAARVKGCPL